MSIEVHLELDIKRLFRCLFYRVNEGGMLLEYFHCKRYLLILTAFSKRREKSLLLLMQHWNVYSVLLHHSSTDSKAVIWQDFFFLSYKYFNIFKARVWSSLMRQTTYGFFPSSVLRCVSRDSRRLSGACRIKQRQKYISELLMITPLKRRHKCHFRPQTPETPHFKTAGSVFFCHGVCSTRS